MKASLFSAFLAVILPLSMQAQCPNVCSPLLYEGFNYTAAQAITGQAGGSGWSNAWNVQNSNTTTPGYQTDNGSLAFGSLRTNYNRFSGGRDFLRVGRGIDVSATGVFANYRNANGYVGAAGTTLWATVLLRKVNNNATTVFAGFHDTNVDWYEGTSTNSNVLVGYFGAANSDLNGVKYWTLAVRGTFVRTNVPIDFANSALLVLKMEFQNAGTTVNLYVNPTNLGSGVDPSVSSAVVNTTPLQLRAFSAYLGESPNQGILDEIRVAPTYRCAAPDANVSENLQPTASFTASTLSGVAPLTVNFDATASSDADGTIAIYDWQFGDGGTRTGATTSYTFQNTGLFFVRMRVTDNCGLSSTTTLNIRVTDANGSFICQARPSLERAAQCNGSGGILNVGAGLATNLTLTNGSGTSFPNVNGRFSNLSAGNYTLQCSSASGCSETFNLTIPVDPSTCPNFQPNLNQLKIGMGLEGLSYWDQARPFKDFMKTSGSTFVTFNHTGQSPWDTNLSDEIATDTEGYPLQIPAQTSGGLQRVRILISADGHMPTGTYVVLYEGQGTLTYHGGISVVSSSAGRTVVNVTGTGNLWFQIEQSTLGNHVRNIRIVRQSDESTYQSQPFYDAFLNRLCLFSPIRFMDWQITNGSLQVNWSDRAKPNDRSQTMRRTVAPEYMAQLGNTLNRDIWVCVPHQATDDYIRQMARFFRDNLNPGLNVFVEYSNEVWNWQFEQAHWVSNNGNQNISYPRRYVERALNAFRIWQQEFGNQSARVKRVMATQTGNTWVSEEIAAHAKGEFDYFAPTFYFGYSGNTSGCLTTLRAQGASATAQDVLNCTRTEMRAFFPSIRQTYQTAWLYNKPIAHYEGGQHMTSNPNEEPFQQALYAAQIHPDMGNLYQEMIDTMRRFGTEYATAFVLTGRRESRYGSWGHLEYIEQDPTAQPAPKWNALLNNFGGNQGTCNVAVPIELSEFSVACEKGKIRVQWTTLSEVQSDFFEILASFDGKNWVKTGVVPAKGNSHTPQYYQYLADFAGENAVFKLKMVDKDGSFAFSKIVATACATEGVRFSVFPNPASDDIWVKMPSVKSQLTYQLSDATGRILISQSIDNQDIARISIAEYKLANGLYWLTLMDERHVIGVEKIVIIR